MGRWNAKQMVLLGGSLLLLVLLASLVEWDRMAEVFARAQVAPLVGATAVGLLFPVFNMLRWMAVLRGMGVRMGWWECFRITMACWPVGTLTPGKAGELLKAVAVRKRGLGIGSVLAERVVDVAVLGVYGVVFGLLAMVPWAVLGGLAGLGGAMVAVGGAQWAERWLGRGGKRDKVRGFLSAMLRLRRRPRYLWACVAASAVNWFLSMVQLALLLDAFGAPPSLPLIMGILPAATFAGLIPISLAGIGTRDGALLFLAAGRLDAAALLASSIMYTLLGYFLLGVLGLPFLWALLKERRTAPSRPPAARKARKARP